MAADKARSVSWYESSEKIAISFVLESGEHKLIEITDAHVAILVDRMVTRLSMRELSKGKP